MMSTAYESSLLTLTPALENCRTAKDIEEVARHFVRPMGLDHIACVKLSAPSEDGGRDRGAIDVQFSTFPGAWLCEGAEAVILENDPVLTRARRSAESFTWREAWKHWEGRGTTARMEAAHALGLADGIAVPMGRSAFITPVVLAAGRSPRLDGATRSAAVLASSAIYRRLTALEETRIRSATRLTERERQCLSWAAAGKSDWEIGQIIALSAKTVNYHIENAKRKSGVQTRVQAIVEALRSGLIA